MLDRRIRQEILSRFEDADAGVRRQAIREAAGHVHESGRLRAALISVTSRDEEPDPEARRVAFEAVAGLFGSHRRATRAVERSLNSSLPEIRRDAAEVIVRATLAEDASATRMLARNLTNDTDEVRTPFVSAARQLIDAGRADELRAQLLLHIESKEATDRILAADLLEAAAVAGRDRAGQGPAPASTTSGGDPDADDSAGRAPEPRLHESVIWAMVRAVEQSHLEPDPRSLLEPDPPSYLELDIQSLLEPDPPSHLEPDIQSGLEPEPEADGAGGDAPLDESPPAADPVIEEPPPEVIPVAPPRSAVDLLAELLSALKEREVFVLGQRGFTRAKPRTLQSIGTTFGVTRERIRQIEFRANAKWRARIQRPDYEPLRDHAEKLSAHLGSAVPLLDDRLPQAADDFCGGLAPERRAAALRILLDFAGYSRTEGWLMRLSPAARDDLATGINELSKHWPVVPRAEIASVLGRHGVAEQHLEPWCTTFSTLRFIAAGAIPKGSSRDDFERLLLHRGETANVPRLLAEAGLTHLNARGARNEALRDPRFTRIDRGAQLAHRDWGFKAYTHITDGIIAELERRGGAAPVGRLCRVLSERFGVANSSVRGRAAAPMFMKTASGVLTFRPEGVPYEFEEDPATSGVCFWHDDHWSLRMVVTRNLLRGSGREIPAQFAAYIGCRPGGEAYLASAWGTVRTVWAQVTPRPAMGSVGPALAATGARQGDLLFVCYHPGSPDVDLRLVQRARPGAVPAGRRIAGELGLHAPIRSLNDVAGALGVEHEGVPASTVWREVQKAVAARPVLDLGALLAARFPELAAASAADGALDASAGD